MAKTPEPRDRFVGLIRIVVALLGLSAFCSAADFDEVETLFRTGHYDETAKLAAEEIAQGTRREAWFRLKIEAEMARGRYPEALGTVEDALRRFPATLPIRVLARDAYRFNGRLDDAVGVMDSIDILIQAAPSRFDTPEGRVALGRYFLIRGYDARKVLDQFFDVARKLKPDLVDVHIATAELALGKQDNALAASTLAKAPKIAQREPRYHYLMALAFADDERKKSDQALDEALKINPNHVDSLLLQADHRIDEERYDDAAKLLDRVAEINPKEPRSWAYRAVLAHLRNDAAGEESNRATALAQWATNPEVDHIIGRELSRKYRFAEGSAYQRRSIEIDPEYRPSRGQLCSDLLRLGDESEGWKLAADIFALDPYDVVAFNLVTLRDRIATFRTLEGDGFVVRMDPTEADLYGARVLALLKKARKTLGEKYGVTINEPVIVEIFPKKREFAVRTFGLPGAEGFLGVCFGRVITANSPASQGESPSNWEAVLWHEFCHAITLGKTKNKMPRWLSEGISVYEEAQEDKSWAGATTPRFRSMILGKDFTPLSRLSSAFLAPKSPMHLQFAYHESALAVEFLIAKSGLDALKGLLDDLGAGKTINESLPTRTGTTLIQLDDEFLAFARKRAESIAPGATWDLADVPGEADSISLQAWVKDHPTSFPGLKRLAARLVYEEKWEPAKLAIARLKALYPEDSGPENADVLLATVHRKTSNPAGERTALLDFVSRDGSALSADLRLMELDEAVADWAGLARDANRTLAVNPLIAAPYRRLGQASEKLGKPDEAILAYRAVARLDDTDPAAVHFALARLLKETGKVEEARLEVLKSLENAPRFLEAHKLLLEIVGPKR